MRFLVDAHLPAGLCKVLERAGHTAQHTLDLPAQNATPDAEICQVSMSGQWVVISKDTDFYHSHLLRGEPWKLVLVRTGNIGVAELKSLFVRHLADIESALAVCTLVEMDRQQVTGLA